VRRAFLLGLLVLGLATPIAGGEEAAPVSEKALWFRIVLGTEPEREVLGFLDETKGTGKGYDVAVVDGDGDGSPETRGSHTLTIHWGPGREETHEQPAASLEHAGRHWSLTFETYHSELSVGPGLTTLVSFDWSAWAEETWVHFINGRVRMYTSLEAARKARPNRLAAPFRWAVGVGTRGPSALVTAALDDAAGARLRIAGRGDDDIRTSLRILRKDGAAEEVVGDYG
jgi:hypothetical protein